jgi:16S rRNA processing protein RimM
MMIKDMIVIGKIADAHGIKGEISVLPMTDDAARFYDTDYFICENTTYEISGVRLHKGRVLLASPQIADRNAAESLKGKLIEVRRQDAVALNERRILHRRPERTDMLTTRLGRRFYILRDVFQAGAADILEFVSGSATVLLPFLSENVGEVNIEKGYMKADMGKGVRS